MSVEDVVYHITDGIVLNKRIIDEADRQICVWTRNLGKIRAVAGGSCRLSARMLSLTEPITQCEFMLYVNHWNSGRMRVVGGELKNMFPDVKKDIVRYSHACKVAEVSDMLTAECDRNENKYSLLLRTYELLEGSENPGNIYLGFLVRFLRLCGYGIEYNKSTDIDRNALSRLKEIGWLPGEKLGGLPPLGEELIEVVEDYLVEFTGLQMKTRRVAGRL